MRGLLYFLTGAAVGAIGTFFYIQKYVIPQVKDDISREIAEKEQAEPHKAPIVVPKDDHDGDEDEEKLVVSDHVNRIAYNAKPAVDYSSYSKDPSTITVTTSEALKDDTEDPSYEGGTPYLIDANSFDELTYTSHRFVLYSDGVVIDDDTEEILDEDPELVFGKTAMDAIKEEDIIFVRNDEKKQDYSLERRDYPFDGPTEGFSVADPDDWRD